MKIVTVKKKEIDYSAFVKRSAVETDYSTLLDEPCLICDESGKPMICYDTIKTDCSLIEKILPEIEYQTTERTGGLKTTSRVFGYQPRVALRRDYCTATSLAIDEPVRNEIICNFGQKLTEYYIEKFPETYKRHESWVEENVKDEWKMHKSPFTSGIINKNNPLKYHFDAGNIKDVCSCMAVFKKEVAGGYLAIPEYDIGIKLSNRTMLIFDGQSILHGVTPIYKMGQNAYRYSVVFYTLQQMWKCEPLDQELARIKNIKSERERKRTLEAVVDLHSEVKE